MMKKIFTAILFMLMSIITINAALASLQDNLTMYMQFENLTQSTMDEKGHLITGWGHTINASGKINNGGLFVNSRIIYNITADFLMTNINYSVAFWIYPTIPHANTTIIFSTRTDGTDNFFQIAHDSFGNKIQANLHSSACGLTDTSVVGNLTIIENVWYHVVVVRDNSSLRIYINNTLRGESAGVVPNSCGTLKELYLGGAYAANLYYIGMMDELGFWRKALSTSEISDLFNSGNGLPYPLTNQTVLAANIMSPADNTVSSQKLNVTYNVTVDSSCSLYTNGILNQTDAAVENSTTQFFYVSDMAEGTHTFYVNCTSIDAQNAVSTARRYKYDATNPVITISTPVTDNSTVFTAQQVTIIGNVTDVNITQINETIKALNGSVVFSNNTLFSGGITAVNLDKIMDASTFGEGVFSYDIYALDDALNPSVLNVTFEIRLLKLDISSPANLTRSNQPLNVQYNVSKNSSTYTCELYINTALNRTNSSVQDGAASNFLISEMAGTAIFYYYISCTDGTSTNTSQTFMYNHDDVQPFMTWNSPSYYNDTIVNANITLDINITDDYLYKVNLTVFAPNGSVVYNNYSGDLMNLTNFYTINHLIDTSLLPQGNYTVFIDAADSHTAKDFKESLVVEEKQKDKDYNLKLSKDTVNFKLSDNLGIKFIKDFDRIKFELDGKAKKEKKQIKFQPIEQMIKIEGSPYACHYVFGDYWFDCEGLENPVESFDKNTNTLTIDFDMSTDKVITESLGGLNEHNETVIFQVDHCDPVWVCADYGNCNTSDLAPCNETSDVNICGLPYTGNYSEFTPEACNYCTASLVLISAGACYPQNDTRTNLYNYTNYQACCAATNISADCELDQFEAAPTGSWATYYYSAACSMFTYTTGDFAAIVSDGIGTAGALIVILLPIIIIGAIVYFLIIRPMKKLR